MPGMISPPLPSPESGQQGEQTASDALIAAMRALQNALDEHDGALASASGLGRSDWRCLRLLAERGDQSPGSLQRALGLTSGSVTALLDRLEQRGLVTRQRLESDRRALAIVPSEAAIALLETANAPLGEIATRLALRWGEARTCAAEHACVDLARLVEWASQRL